MRVWGVAGLEATAWSGQGAGPGDGLDQGRSPGLDSAWAPVRGGVGDSVKAVCVGVGGFGHKAALAYVVEGRHMVVQQCNRPRACAHGFR